MAYYDSSGILLVRLGHLEVYFCKSRSYRDTYCSDYRRECQEVFAKHGFMEAVLLPYRVEPFGLVVSCPSKEAESSGWLQAECANDDIPF